MELGEIRDVGWNGRRGVPSWGADHAEIATDATTIASLESCRRPKYASLSLRLAFLMRPNFYGSAENPHYMSGGGDPDFGKVD